MQQCLLNVGREKKEEKGKEGNKKNCAKGFRRETVHIHFNFQNNQYT
jgi:hypothetical protein